MSDPTTPTREQTIERLRAGEIPFGPALVRWRCNRADFQQKTGARFGAPDRAWRHPAQLDGVAHVVELPVAWRGPCRVELVFLDELLASVDFEDAGWVASTSWDDLDYGRMVRDYRASRETLIALLGEPDEEAAEMESALYASWVLGPTTLRLYCEGRTPANGIILRDASRPR